MKNYLISLIIIVTAWQVTYSQEEDTVWTRQNNPDIWDVKFSPDDSKIITIGSGNRIRFYDTPTGTELKMLDSAWYLMIDNERNRVYTTFLTHIFAWDINTYEKFDYFEKPKKELHFPVYSVKNNKLAAIEGPLNTPWATGNTFTIWDCVTGKIFYTKTYPDYYNPKTGHTFPAGYLKIYYDDGRNIFGVYASYADYDPEDPKNTFTSKEICEIYDATTMELISDEYNLNLCRPDYISPSGKYIAVFEKDSAKVDVLVLKTTTTFEKELILPIIKKENISALIFSKDDHYLIYSWRGDFKSRVIDLKTKQEIYFYPGMSSLDMSIDKRFITCSVGSTLKLYKMSWYSSYTEKNNNFFALINFPNPTKNIINIRFTINEPDYTSIDIVNLSGYDTINLFHNFLTQVDNDFTFDLSSYPSGVYIIKIQSGKYIFIEKLILNK